MQQGKLLKDQATGREVTDTDRKAFLVKNFQREGVLTRSYVESVPENRALAKKFHPIATVETSKLPTIITRSILELQENFQRQSYSKQQDKKVLCKNELRRTESGEDTSKRVNLVTTVKIRHIQHKITSSIPVTF